MDFEKLKEWRAQLLKEIEDLEAKLEPIQAEVKMRKEKLSSIQRLIVLESNPSLALGKIENSISVGQAGKTIRDIAYKVLKDFHAPLHYKLLYEAIQQTGFNINGKDPATNLIAHISSDPRFVRVKRGTYALKEWGLKPRKTRRNKKRRLKMTEAK